MKTQTPLREKTIYANRLLIWRNLLTDTPTARNLWAILPTNEYDMKETNLHDWKADFKDGENKGSIYARGEVYLGDGRYDKFEDTFPCMREDEPLKAPGRNFVWTGFSGNWRNTKTGKRLAAY